MRKRARGPLTRNEPEKESFRLRVSALATAMGWLRDHNLSAERIGALFGITGNHVRVLLHRWENQQRKARFSTLRATITTPEDTFEKKVDPAVRKLLRIPEEVEADDGSDLSKVEEGIEQLGVNFWGSVRYLEGVAQIRKMIQQMGRPTHLERLRHLARLRHLLAETHLHAGFTATAIQEGLHSLNISRTLYQEWEEPLDLERISSISLILSQAYLLRAEPDEARFYLDICCQADERLGSKVDPDCLRQIGVYHFQKNKFDEARIFFERAGEAMRGRIVYGRETQEYEILSSSVRHINLIAPGQWPDWDDARELLQYMMRRLPPDDLHISQNVNWTVACGLSTDSPKEHAEAMQILNRHQDAAKGYGHQTTVAKLLSLTLDLPPALHPLWAKKALYLNAYSSR